MTRIVLVALLGVLGPLMIVIGLIMGNAWVAYAGLAWLFVGPNVVRRLIVEPAIRRAQLTSSDPSR